ncbi:hypothetical protein [Rhodobacter lacus]|uniref:Lipoprotein n=1 Tax=Rhodobacter lacus TaxID=1641972 RepID=A0ABW5A9L5_9RHOB
MIGASKILTVSYGTFSCTLEGFDEPFNTMKAIAEYFRDLAADDRYFGAEPPQPDAEMLHRIAEREIQRRVEAKIQKNGVVLRPRMGAPGAEEAPGMVVPAAQQVVAPEAAPRPTPVYGSIPLASIPAASIPVAAPDAAPETAPTTADPVSDSVAAKLQRIRAAVAHARAEPATAAAPAPKEALPMAAPPQPAEPDSQRPVAAPPEGAAEAEAEPAPLAPVAAEDPSEDEERTDAPSDPVASDADFGFALDISGPLSAVEAAQIADENRIEPEQAEASAAPEMTATAAEPPAQGGEAAAEGPAEEAAEEPAPIDAAPVGEAPVDEAPVDEAERIQLERQRRRAERLAARMALAEAEQVEKALKLRAEAEARQRASMAQSAEDAASAPAAAQADAPAKAAAPRPVIRARVIKLRRAEPVAAQDTPADAAAPQDDADALLAAVAAQLSSAEPSPESDLEIAPASAEMQETEIPEADDTLMAELATLAEDLPDDSDWGSLAAVQHAIAEAIPDEAALAPETDADPEAPAAAMTAAAMTAAEDAAEDDAAAPGEEIEAQDDAAPETPRDLHAADLAPPAMARSPRPVAEGDLSRLLEKTDAQMAGSENQRRISAIAHLKAAVAATVAERRAGNRAQSDADTDQTEPYRQDLHQAVRPRRPVGLVETGATGARASVPGARPELRPAPLVLVSEQRVDQLPSVDEAHAQAVRPRRVTTASLHRMQEEDAAVAADAAPEERAADEAATGFAEFARARAPQGLAELLEAAAAYTAQVEGRPHFSPPQIMRKVTALETEDISREDRLRVFGTLLRQGKIAKVKRGQYAITEASRFFERRA